MRACNVVLCIGCCGWKIEEEKMCGFADDENKF